MVTSHDVARLAGVSQPTVSRALRDDPRVSEATRQRVRDAAEALGYAPNAIGRALSVGRSTRIGLVVTDLDNQFYAHMIAPLHAELTRLGYELVLITEASEQAPIAEHAAANGLCGLILTTTTTDSVLPVRLRDRGVPFLYFNRIATTVTADSVTVDPEPGMRTLVAEILGHGHRRIGTVFGPRNTSTGDSRAEVLLRLLEEYDVQVPRHQRRYGPFDFATGDRFTRELIGLDPAPTVIVCGNDVVALGALNAAAELNIAVPEQLSVVGFDDLPTSRWAMVQLTTVCYDLEAMTVAAARMIVDRVNDPNAAARREVFSTGFVPRRTLGPAPS